MGLSTPPSSRSTTSLNKTRAWSSRSIPTVLKNAIDWGTRPRGKTSRLNKPATVTGASGAQGPHLMGGEGYILFKPGMFDDSHTESDSNIRDFLKTFVEKFAVIAGKLATS